MIIDRLPRNAGLFICDIMPFMNKGLWTAIGVILLGLLVWGGYIWSKKNAQTPAQSGQTGSVRNMQHLITLKTTLGDIQFATYDADAPKTVENFITLAQKGFYSNVIFHRVIKGFMIQTGDPTGTGRGGPGYTFADELNPDTQSYKEGYVKGVVAMANAGADTNGSQFFIMAADYPLPHDYTIFGKVAAGQEVVDKIDNLPTDANDRPLNPPKILSVTVESR